MLGVSWGCVGSVIIQILHPTVSVVWVKSLTFVLGYVTIHFVLVQNVCGFAVIVVLHAIIGHLLACSWIVVQLHSQSLRLDSGRSYTRCTGSVRFQPNINSAGYILWFRVSHFCRPSRHMNVPVSLFSVMNIASWASIVQLSHAI